MALIRNAPNDYHVVDKSFMMLRVWYSWVQDLVNALNGSKETLDASGAVALSTTIAYLDGTSSVVSATLADGFDGQEISFKAIDVSNAVTLVPANFRDGTTITFPAVNQYIRLVFDGEVWNNFGGNATIT